jgi:hypothetical protein
MPAGFAGHNPSDNSGPLAVLEIFRSNSPREGKELVQIRERCW